MGERVAFYNASLTCLQEARSIYGNGKVTFTGLPGENKAIEEALTFTNDVIEGKRKAAKNENEYIYHEEVPDKDSLATVKGASLVKGISFSVEDIEVSGPDIFARYINKNLIIKWEKINTIETRKSILVIFGFLDF